jgi:predicted RNase H-like HicB family nuclease
VRKAAIEFTSEMGVKEILNFQNVKGKAKPYQVKQFLKVIERYNLLEGIEMYGCTIEIFYSEEDEGYIAVVPELLGCSAFGEAEEEALREIKTAIELWIETAKKEGREIPKPMRNIKAKVV